MNRLMKLILGVLSLTAVILALVIFVDSVSDNEKPVMAETPTVKPIDTFSPDDSDQPTDTPEATPEPTPDLPLSGLVICIDAGHQQKQNAGKEPCAPWDPSQNAEINNTVMKTKTASGTQGQFTNVPEYVVTLQISLKLRDMLTAQGAKVIMIRETDNVDLSNIDRAVIGNEAKSDLVIRIHCNGSSNASAKGVEMWIRGNGSGTEEYLALGNYEYELASEMLTYITDATGAAKRYVNKSDAYTGLNWSEVPSIIIECGFMSNEEEDRLLITDEYQQKIAQGITDWFLATGKLKK